MRAVIQRVSEASVRVDGEVVGEIRRGLLLLVCVVPDDDESDLETLVKKVSRMRIFPDEEGVMNLSVTDVGGEVLCVSQFTLAASVRKGNRPSYIGAAGREKAVPMYEQLCEALSEAVGVRVQRGVFGADMKVSLVNDGPVTIVMDTKDLK